MICAGNVARMGRITYGILVGKPKASNYLEAVGVRGENYVKRVLKIIWWEGVDWVYLAQDGEKRQVLKVCKSVHHHAIQISHSTRCNSFSSLLLDVYVQLNMFRASSRPSSGAQQLQQQPLVLPLERGGSSAVSRGRALLPQRYNGKARGCYCSCWAPNDGSEEARNMLSCT